MIKNAKLFFLPVLIIFFTVTAIGFVFGNFFKTHQIDNNVLLVANAILFLVTIFNLSMYIRSMQNPNPNVFLRSITSSTIIKLFIIGGGVLAYLYFSSNKSIFAVIGVMILYLVYTIFEVKGALKINRKSNGSS